MEYCPHGSLYTLLEQPENNFGLAEDEFLRVLTQVTAGVKHLRDNDIIHRDIKPGNILRSVAADGRSVFKLTDFGAARELQQDEEFLSLYGTDEYLHPHMYERAVLRKSRGQQFGCYVDLWSLGVTFYHTATGSLPFRPYGGRKNRDTMFRITAKKEHGVISGIQEVQDGPIKWSRDLPPTCTLSRGLQLLVTPFLASLLEKDPDKTVSFEEFFSQVDDISHRIAYDVFCPSSFSLLKVYTRPRDDMSLLRQLITDQTDILGGAQLLLHDGKVLVEESRNSVASLLTQVSSDNPIFVFNRLPEYKMFMKPAYGSFLDIPPETSVDTDYPLCKRNFAVLHSVRSSVKSLLLRNSLMTRAVKMYSSYVNQKNLRLQLSVSHVKRGCIESKIWKEQLFASLDIQVNMFKSLASSNLKPTNIDLSGRMNVLNTLQQAGHRDCQQLSASLQTKLEQALSLLQSLQSGQTMDTEWKPSIGCLPKDRCIQKMDIMIQKLQKIMTSFREDRNKRQLSNNDEQIHRFDKNKMKEICVTAQTLIEDDCTTKSVKLFKAFKQCYSRAVQIHDAGERLEMLVREMLQTQDRLVEKLRNSGKQCVQQSESCLQALNQPGAKLSCNGDAPEKKEASKSENGSDSWPELNGGSTTTSSTASSSRQNKLDLMLDKLQTTRTDLEEVTALLHENTSMMERFQMLHTQDGSEDLKSWEYVGNWYSYQLLDWFRMQV
ncbi:serine/threonine-protein kinase TBK1 [Elysia marginata]|uniref:Serine/threonine-protein kinase TBK1 n=1 Tax=Elysia marginata TaxID=1093978 RepID=A0AAV4F0G3_9GAST|nr:serine/threonine-protein kinase TBK1 [Elysia marginata]